MESKSTPSVRIYTIRTGADITHLSTMCQEEIGEGYVFNALRIGKSIYAIYDPPSSIDTKDIRAFAVISRRKSDLSTLVLAVLCVHPDERTTVWSEHDEGGEGKLREIKKRGKGYGKRLLSYIEKEAKNRPEITLIQLESADDNATSFYKTLGYTVTGESDDGNDIMVKSLRLPPPSGGRKTRRKQASKTRRARRRVT